MTDREKLVALMKQVDACICNLCCGEGRFNHSAGILADHLLANGVVVREKGENLTADTSSLFECSKCGWFDWDTYTTDTGVYNFCPNCGADMRKGENR